MKRPKRKVNNTQYLLFEDMISSVETIPPSVENEECYLYTSPVRVLDDNDVGLITNKIYCGDTVETMKKINGGTINMVFSIYSAR